MSIHREGMENQERIRVIVALYYEICSHFTENNKMTKKQYVKMKNKAKKNPFDLSIMKPVNQKFIYKFMKWINSTIYGSKEFEAWDDWDKNRWGMIHDIHRGSYQGEFPTCTLPLYRQQEWNSCGKVIYRNGKHDIYGNRK